MITVPADSADVRGDLLAALGALRDDRVHPGVIQHHHQAGQSGAVVFVFPGQGGQYLGMGASFIATTAASLRLWMSVIGCCVRGRVGRCVRCCVRIRRRRR